MTYLLYLDIMTSNKKYNFVSSENRNLLIDHIYRDGMTIREAATKLNINYSAARRIKSIFTKTGATVPNKRGKPPMRKITDPIIALIVEETGKCDKLTLNDIAKKVKEAFDVKISKSTVRNELVKLKITLNRSHRKFYRFDHKNSSPKNVPPLERADATSAKNKEERISIDEQTFYWRT
ncbi:uncharacterized protein LOC135929948 isoform X2 [Gordionus sp. m RMFG-2023]|uniref:uncharacterized protein LOC135929948 isoform X2 n=1 Tax=Gordionus sp. m RMFG-2023 TaxID=3053472 RepID=UPI0031FCE8D1